MYRIYRIYRIYPILSYPSIYLSVYLFVCLSIHMLPDLTDRHASLRCAVCGLISDLGSRQVDDGQDEPETAHGTPRARRRLRHFGIFTFQFQAIA